MSWMDSWSRPGKSQATPAPYYLLPGGDSTPYCRSCGRVISGRRANAAAPPPPPPQKNNSGSASQKPSYCSQRCRNTKPRRLDREIEATFARMLSEGGEPGGGGGAQQARQGGKHGKSGKKERKGVTKGDPRVIVTCDAVEKAMFGDLADPEKSFGRKKNRASRVLPAAEVETDTAAPDPEARHREDGDHALDETRDSTGDGDSAVALSDSDDDDASSIDGDVLARMAVRSGTRVRPPQHASFVNGSVGGEKGRAERGEETEEMAARRVEGQRRALRREMVRSAARRGVVFGFAVARERMEETTTRKCEAVMQGKVVEPSFAKGDWGVRWRE
ncbi:hypothetical protein GGR53DRAFT_522605 [Hypoxylon sp. FL1150]|nr:hypothetical protein GGR53DRAFT_522605 [Hypoxylon sp. FL1150]